MAMATTTQWRVEKRKEEKKAYKIEFKHHYQQRYEELQRQQKIQKKTYETYAQERKKTTANCEQNINVI